MSCMMKCSDSGTKKLLPLCQNVHNWVLHDFQSGAMVVTCFIFPAAMPVIAYTFHHDCHTIAKVPCSDLCLDNPKKVPL